MTIASFDYGAGRRDLVTVPAKAAPRAAPSLLELHREWSQLEDEYGAIAAAIGEAEIAGQVKPVYPRCPDCTVTLPSLHAIHTHIAECHFLSAAGRAAHVARLADELTAQEGAHLAARERAGIAPLDRRLEEIRLEINRRVEAILDAPVTDASLLPILFDLALQYDDVLPGDPQGAAKWEHGSYFLRALGRLFPQIELTSLRRLMPDDQRRKVLNPTT